MYKLSIAKQVGGAVVATFIASGTVSAATVLSNSHNYGGLITINVTVEDNYLGDFSKYFWKYDVTNHTYDPTPVPATDSPVLNSLYQMRRVWV